MASQFQNRLVGTVILVAVGITVLPMLFDGKKKHYEDQFAAIPLVSRPGDPEEIDVGMPLNQSLPVQPPEGAANAAKLQREEKSERGAAYVVQLGALKNAANVNEIVAKLRLSGYHVYTLPPTPVNGQITRIMVEVNNSKQKLQAALPELNALSGLNGQVKALESYHGLD
ncbi:SPOR domain-containing protein [Candidatus Fukatsuia symbiotica]|uniref:Sporulation protein n=1 Tax=Candidatus Fukatsuia symbiotica TaxID=1878942 RepID=A0A2U8I3X9_9GAMM|nr:SPOR domain-containing protein [Candidatus Fukatsuia symbiotica]AWK13831.1 sporulation protein [Candidatus Fukatsuia symbiotica]MEA9446034.1 SPOR domain-containing protein [Candidatus Fukatsuia symbiotica]